ncbi:pyridoxal-phosphate dependent enzyme [Halapricum sp. CBA1109]|uniref:threonine synthase n=1 Tax=Halapricum sp. CBA1109 TaxID=2668068 RepID=UPI0012F88F6F|nr:threonine synthase [Halapricum sp. CBA1109]MUV89356.1 pyridoxal-phosphate dependent enzyme [Halapricum sp. CBA1109]
MPATHTLVCTDCGAEHDPATTTHRCPDCEGVLDPRLDVGAVDVGPETLAGRPFDGIERYAELLPLPASSLVSVGAGATPLVSAPTLADRWGVESVWIKDEGANPTGSTADRGATLAVSAAADHGAETVALATSGDAGQSVAAVAARAGLDSESFVPSRSTFDTKAMINVHGGEMNVVGGRLDDAIEAFSDALTGEETWHSVGAFDSPYRHAGAKTLLYEVLEQRDWTAPDHVVYPVGHGTGLVGGAGAARELDRLGLIADVPTLHAAQAAGCAPVVDAFDAGEIDPQSVGRPDTICGGLEVPDPAGGALVLDAVRDSGGTAVASEDDDILEHAVTIAQEAGIGVGTGGGAAASAAAQLADRGAFGEDDTVVVVNPSSANKESDVLRSHLMSKGI